MNKAWWALLVAGVVATTAMAGSAKEFVLAMPAGIDASRRVVLELREVRLPRNAAVVFRARAIDEDGAEVALGSVGLLAEASDAEGMALHATVRIEVTKALKRWRQDHPGVEGIRLRVVPFSGGTPLADLEWSAESADLKVVTP